MMRYQASLPHLPVPDLVKSIEKYLVAMQPLVGAEQLEKTRQVAKDFVKPGGVGEELQQKLLARAKSTDNWVGQQWISRTGNLFKLYRN